MAASDLEIVVRAGADGLASDLNRMASYLRTFAKDAERSKPKIESPAMDFKPILLAATSIRTLGQESAKTSLSLAKVAMAGPMIAASFAAVQVAGRVVTDTFDHIKDSIVKAADFEQTSIAFETLLQSASDAQKMLSEIRQYSAIAPFRNEEVTNSARSLLAYGVAAEQIIPTIKMLGDVSAGFGKNAKLEDLTYLYGKVFSTQRAYAIEIREFALRGIPIWEELSKVMGKSRQDLEKLVEEGRVGRDEITQAFVNMSSGRFAGMVEKQGHTLAGLWTTTLDSFDRLKINFGNILIKEWGLKAVSQDLANFANNVSGGLDRIRPGVKLVGDLVKGITQLGYEFARAGIQIAEFNIDNLQKAFPGLAKTFKNLQDSVSGLQNFKLDQRQITQLALDLFEEIGTGFAKLVDWVDTEGHQYADSFRKNFVDPIKDMIDGLRNAYGFLKYVTKSVASVSLNPNPKQVQEMSVQDFQGWIDKPKNQQWVQDWLAIRKDPAKRADRELELKHYFNPVEAMLAAGDMNQYPFPTRNMKPGQEKLFIEEYRNLDLMIRQSREAVDMGWNNAREAMAILVNRRNDILSMFGSGKSVANGDIDVSSGDWAAINHEILKEGKVRREVQREGSRTPLNAVQKFEDFFKPFKDMVIANDAKRSMQEQIDQQQRVADEAKRVADTFNSIGDNLAAQLVSGGLGAVASGFQRPFGHGVKLQNDLNPAIFDLAKKASTEFGDPREAIKQLVSDLKTATETIDKVTGKPLLRSDVADVFLNKQLMGFAEKLGIGGEPKLSHAALVGTVEDARLLARFQVGYGQQTTEGLLKSILDLLKEKFDEHDKDKVRDGLDGGGNGVITICG